MNNITPEEYNQLTNIESSKTKSYKTIPMAYIIGGLICVIAQVLIEIFKSSGITQDVSPILASVSLVFMSAVLTGFNIYDNIAKVGGAGTLVPITGFANAVVSPALEFKSEGYILGLGAKMFIIAGPVIVYGTLASVLYGVIVYIFGL